ncbi:MAG: 4a-hydroxytetrahydrobiopterin dehydratase [bacterium]
MPTNPLANQPCESCESGAPPLDEAQTAALLAELPDWHINEYDREKHLVRTYHFDDFQHALNFTIEIGELAEQSNHHPSIITAWGKVTLHWWTHSIGGLHRNDFVLAARCDKAFEAAVSR